MKKNSTEALEPNEENRGAYDGIAKCNATIERMMHMKIDKALAFLEDVEKTAESKFEDERTRVGFVKVALPSAVDYRVLKFWITARRGFFKRIANE